MKNGENVFFDYMQPSFLDALRPEAGSLPVGSHNLQEHHHERHICYTTIQ